MAPAALEEAVAPRLAAVALRLEAAIPPAVEALEVAVRSNTLRF